MGQINNSWYTSDSEEWATPQHVFDELNREFGFTLDVCASAINHKVDQYFTREDNALTQVWGGVCWMNPPYGRTIGQWMKKALETSQQGTTVVCLVPARTDTAWWHDYAMKGEYRLLRGRLKFVKPDGTSKDAAPFPSAIVIFRGVE
jgi:phage N-6-adenine-methyltransferase